MGIKVNSNFEFQLKKFSDERQSYATIAEMAACNENLIPNGFITFCDEDNTNYQWLELNEVDPTLNKWRPFTPSSDIIDDSLNSSLTKTYSIDKIKQLMKSTGGFVLVDVLPDLSEESQRALVDETKIYLVPNVTPASANTKDEYICIHIPAHPDIYREALVTADGDWTTWKAEIESYVTGGGSLSDDFATYSGVETTTTLTEATYAEMVESINESDASYDAYVARVTAIIISPASEESWSWELIGNIGSADIVFDDFTPNNPIGKVKTGVSLLNKDVISVIKDMLSVDQATTISLSGDPSSATLNEKGVASITDVVLTATISLGTGVIAESTDIVFKKDGVAIDTQPFSKDTLTYTYTDAGANVEDNVTYSVEVEYTMGETTAKASNSITYKFALPMFYGVSSTNTIADVTSLTKIVSESSKQNVSYTANNGYCVFCVPDIKSITSIKDANNFENIDSWSVSTQSVTIGSEAVVYKVYVSNTPVTCTNFAYAITLA